MQRKGNRAGARNEKTHTAFWLLSHHTNRLLLRRYYNGKRGMLSFDGLEFALLATLSDPVSGLGR